MTDLNTPDWRPVGRINPDPSMHTDIGATVEVNLGLYDGLFEPNPAIVALRIDDGSVFTFSYDEFLQLRDAVINADIVIDAQDQIDTITLNAAMGVTL